MAIAPIDFVEKFKADPRRNFTISDLIEEAATWIEEHPDHPRIVNSNMTAEDVVRDMLLSLFKVSVLNICEHDPHYEKGYLETVTMLTFRYGHTVPSFPTMDISKAEVPINFFVYSKNDIAMFTSEYALSLSLSESIYRTSGYVNINKNMRTVYVRPLFAEIEIMDKFISATLTNSVFGLACGFVSEKSDPTEKLHANTELYFQDDCDYPVYVLGHLTCKDIITGELIPAHTTPSYSDFMEKKNLENQARIDINEELKKLNTEIKKIPLGVDITSPLSAPPVFPKADPLDHPKWIVENQVVTPSEPNATIMETVYSLFNDALTPLVGRGINISQEIYACASAISDHAQRDARRIHHAARIASAVANVISAITKHMEKPHGIAAPESTEIQSVTSVITKDNKEIHIHLHL